MHTSRTRNAMQDIVAFFSAEAAGPPSPRRTFYRRRRRRFVSSGILLFLLVALAASPCATAAADYDASVSKNDSDNDKDDEEVSTTTSWTVGEEGLGTFETCDKCDQCLLDDVPEGAAPPTPARNAEGIVHCKKCLGCNVVLSRLGDKAKSRTLNRKTVAVNTGASGAAILKGRTADRGEVFVKVWCGLEGQFKQNWKRDAVPETCKHDGMRRRPS